MESFILPFSEIGRADIPHVGGKNASIGEMMRELQPRGIRIPDGFAVTADAFRYFLEENLLVSRLRDELANLDTKTFSNLTVTSNRCRELVLQGKIPSNLRDSIVKAYLDLCADSGIMLDVAVRSSATAEDLPSASFAGQHESFLNIRGAEQVVQAVQRCYASLYNARAIKYRHDNGFSHEQVLLSAGIQRMVRSDLACSGTSFTLDPETGFRDVVVISGVYGLGENIVLGHVSPDEFVVFKPGLKKGKECILSARMGTKLKTMIYADADDKSLRLVNVDTPLNRQSQWVLTKEEVCRLADWSISIEEHYNTPMDIEWAKDGRDGQLYIVQARPETVHAKKRELTFQEYRIRQKGARLCEGNAVGTGIATGIARILKSPAEADKLKAGEVLVTDITNPDWDPILQRAAAIVTNQGGRTSHAAIVAREIGAVAVVGCQNATSRIRDGQQITVSCAEGKTGFIYEGEGKWDEIRINPDEIPHPEVPALLILAEPDKAFQYARYPSQGVGLLRLEFIINNSIRIHPMALVKADRVSSGAIRAEIQQLTKTYASPSEYFIEKLSQAVATIAAAFYPRPVIVRMSDFKTNEYAHLLGGEEFEPQEENPMIGFRGASRYDHERYREGFVLECAAMKRVRDDMGLTNVKLMIPFCRTVDEGRRVVKLMNRQGLVQGVDGLEIYVMAEIPSNIILAEQFAEIFDGFSIGSNDLTQLTLGIDRDSGILQGLFDENNEAVKELIRQVIRTGLRLGKPVGLCGQAPSDDPSFARFLVQEGISSISFNPDALLKGIENMAAIARPVRD